MGNFTDYLGQRGVQGAQTHQMPDGSRMAGPPMAGGQGQGQGQGQTAGFGPFVAQLLAALAARQQQQRSEQHPSYQMGRALGQQMMGRR